MTVATPRETDRFAWLEQQTRLLKSGRLGELDVALLIEELESEMGNERRELCPYSPDEILSRDFWPP